MRAVSYAVVFLIGALGMYLILSFRDADVRAGAPPKVSGFELPVYLDFLAVLLATVTAVLTAVAIGIGLVAAFTFRNLEDRAEKVAEKAAEKRAAETLTEDAIRARINAVAFGVGGRSLNELEDGYDPSDRGDQ